MGKRLHVECEKLNVIHSFAAVVAFINDDDAHTIEREREGRRRKIQLNFCQENFCLCLSFSLA